MQRHMHKTQTDLREMKDRWCKKKAVEVQGYADRHEIKEFYASLKDTIIIIQYIYFDVPYVAISYSWAREQATTSNTKVYKDVSLNGI